MEVSETSRNMVLVLGMHRAGTSALAGVLQYLGCGMPKQVMAAHENNPRGYFESQGVRRFNDRLLAASGSNWRDWRAFNEKLLTPLEAQSFTEEARELLDDEFGHAELVMLKEPRLCRVMPFWLDVMQAANFNVLPILTHRSPFEVAKSLEARDGILAEEAMLLWLRHVLDAEWRTRGLSRYVTSYQKLLEDWSDTTARAEEALGVTWPHREHAAKEIDDFLSKDLRHHKQASDGVTANPAFSAWVSECYDIMERWAEEGCDPADYAALDRIRTEFDIAARDFGGLVNSVRQITEAKLRAEQRRAGGLESRLKEREAQIDRLKADLEDAGRCDQTRERRNTDTQPEIQCESVRRRILQWRLDTVRAQLLQGHSALAEQWLETVKAEEQAEISEAYADLLTDALREAEALNAALSDRVTVLEATEKDLQRDMAKMAKIVSKSEELRIIAKSHLKQVERDRDTAIASNAGNLAEVQRLSSMEAEQRRKKEAALEVNAANMAQINRLSAKAEEQRQKKLAAIEQNAAKKKQIDRLTLREAEERRQKETNATLLATALQERDAAREANDVSLAEIARLTLEAANDRRVRDAKISDLAAEIEAMRGSASWRLSKPFRELGGLLRNGQD